MTPAILAVDSGSGAVKVAVGAAMPKTVPDVRWHYPIYSDANLFGAAAEQAARESGAGHRGALQFTVDDGG